MQFSFPQLVLGLVFEKASCLTQNTVGVAREFMRNALHDDRTFAAMDAQEVYYEPPSLFNTIDDSYSRTALDKLGDYNRNRNINVYAMDTGVQGRKDFSILVGGADFLQPRTYLNVTPETTNGQFFKLIEALKDCTDPEEARRMATELAPAIFGTSLRGITTSEELQHKRDMEMITGNTHPLAQKSIM